MTTHDTAALSAPDGPLDPVEAADVLKRLQDSVLGLLAGLDRPPRSLRIRAAQVELEVEWPEPAPAAGPAVAAGVTIVEPLAGPDTGLYVTADMVGVFYRCPEPGAKPFVDVGDLVGPGQQVGIIEAMKLMVPVESAVAGRVVEVLVSDGESVEYGDRLFAVEPADS
jgi:acetyl-CoA carboxylase biotin carboxyl carrier protein